MPKPFPVIRVVEDENDAADAGSLAAGLEARIAELERSATPADFDPASWVWMGVLGIAVPAALILLGWRA